MVENGVLLTSVEVFEKSKICIRILICLAADGESEEFLIGGCVFALDNLFYCFNSAAASSFLAKLYHAESALTNF